MQPWIDDSPGYTRAIVRIGTCSGILIDQDWVLTARHCQAQVGDPVVSIRPSGSVTTAIDRIDDNQATGDDSRYAHLLQPIADVPAVPLHWGRTDEIIGNPITCYGYAGNDLWLATLPTRAHADQTTNPGAFETVRDGTVLPGGGGGPCFFHDQLAAVDGPWLANRTGALETSFAAFRSWMVATMRRERARLFQVVENSVVYLMDKSQQLWRVDSSGAPTLVDQNVRTFHAIDASTVYVVGYDRILWRETPDSNDRTLVDATVIDVSGVDASAVYVLGFDFNLWREEGSYLTRAYVDGTVLQFRPLGSSRVFVLGYDRWLWNQTGDDNKDRTRVDTDVVSFQPVSDTTAYVLSDDFSLWRETTTRAIATKVDANVWDIQAMDASLVYVLHQDGTLWRERGTAADSDRVDSAVAAFQALDATTVYVLDQDGNLWREQGNSASRVLVARR